MKGPNAARSQLLQVATAAGIPVRDAWLGESSSLLFSLISVPDFSSAAALFSAAGASEVRSDVSAVSAVAVGVGRLPDLLERALACLPSSVLATSLSPLRLCAVLPQRDAPALERAWHTLYR